MNYNIQKIFDVLSLPTVVDNNILILNRTLCIVYIIVLFLIEDYTYF